MSTPTVLISGDAGITGPALACWLTRAGYHIVVVEMGTSLATPVGMWRVGLSR